MRCVGRNRIRIMPWLTKVMAFFMHINEYGLCSKKNKTYSVSRICYSIRRIGHILQDEYVHDCSQTVFGSHGGFRKHPLFRGIQGGIRQKLRKT